MECSRSVKADDMQAVEALVGYQEDVRLRAANYLVRVRAILLFHPRAGHTRERKKRGAAPQLPVLLHMEAGEASRSVVRDQQKALAAREA